MYEEIKEFVEVAAVFVGGKAVPKAFFWRGRKYIVEKINLEHQERQGSDPLFYFSVTAAGNSYELSFDSHNLVWKLERIWTK
ncbi:MAG: DUF6504 family protein [Patescibacteria group bacterium]|nr:DUF6504 family protein [Patescibacteria group bacterium]MCL5431806.1 DUF6504 family protein [Patescibacteria group bacterium]